MNQKQKTLKQLLQAEKIEYPEVPPDIPHGDMPGDRIVIGNEHIAKAKTIFPLLLSHLKKLTCTGQEKIVVCVCGGSGVGKSEIASILAFWLNHCGIGTYVLSGDNYPRRFPMHNDAERLRCFREEGIRGMVHEGKGGEAEFETLRQLQKRSDDANPDYTEQYPWFESYLRNGRIGLERYLGTVNEIHFEEVCGLLKEFHRGEAAIWLRRLGRTDDALWYERVDFSQTNILILEWTHGNSNWIQGVDIPVLLNSTPRETLDHRRARNRDGKTDSAFTRLILEIEQGLLNEQAHRAKVIVAKSGEVLSFEKYKELMEAGNGG